MMEKYDLIQEFADGNLNSSQEADFFHQLAVDDEMRSDFKQELAIKTAVRSDSKAFTPTAKSTMAVFGALGFSAPAAVAAAPTATTTGVQTAGFIAKYSAFITGIAATVATAIITYFVFQDSITDLNNENSELLTKIVQLENQNNVPLVQSKETENVEIQKKESNSINQAPIIKYVYIEKETNSLAKDEFESLIVEENVSGDLEEKKVFNIALSSINSDNNYQFYNLNNDFNRIHGAPIENQNLFMLDNDLGLVFEFSKLENWHESSPTINPKSFSRFNNSVFNVLYKINENFLAGIEYRQETFFQNFNGTDENNDEFNYQQQPNFSSFGAVIRYANEDWNLAGIYPYSQLYAGGTNVGYIGRMLLGLKYSPYKNITFHLGAEYSKLFYQHQNISYQTGRYDLNYGISVGF